MFICSDVSLRSVRPFTPTRALPLSAGCCARRGGVRIEEASELARSIPPCLRSTRSLPRPLVSITRVRNSSPRRGTFSERVSAQSAEFTFVEISVSPVGEPR
eukprot:9765266-Alexandrium_andersonii.AAC.1